MDEVIFKVCDRAAWSDACAVGSFKGSADDLRDGFIHLSTADQLEGTLRKHFAGQADLIRIAFRADALGPGLKWEPARNGALFPHLYGPLPTALAIEVAGITWDDDGGPRIGHNGEGENTA